MVATCLDVPYHCDVNTHLHTAHSVWSNHCFYTIGTQEFSVPQIEYPLGGGAVLLRHQVTMVVASEQHLYQTIVQFNKTIVLPRKLATGSIPDYIFCYCPLVGILFEVLQIGFPQEGIFVRRVLISKAQTHSTVCCQCQDNIAIC